jgi:DNA polymerase-3 subunit epsilon
MQRSFDDLGTPLAEATFCVLDLETTGGRPADDTITEIGAVRYRGGERLGTFHTMVNPGRAIPPEITVLTGITQSLVARAPRIEAVLPSLLEFLGRDAVIVGHNVRFDLGFLNAALERAQRPVLRQRSIDTCALARRLVRDEVPNCKLGTLADRFRLPHRPTHRALDDALATADLLHLLIERATGLGVTGIDDLLALPNLANSAHVGKLRLTDGLPRRPGVYLFRDARGEVLYVGKATNLRSRVRSYFSSETRRKVGNLLRETNRIDHQVCQGALEATVLELRLIQQLSPRYNRAGARRTAPVFVRLSAERFPRLTVVRTPPPPEVAALGPLAPAVATLVVEAIQSAVPLRRCTARIGRTLRDAPCTPAQLGVATCPCAGGIDEASYAVLAQRVECGIREQPALLLDPLRERMAALAMTDRFEEAAAVRDRAEALAGALRRRRRVEGLRASGRVVLEVRGEGRVELVHGRLHTESSGEHPQLFDPAPLPDGASPRGASSLVQADDELHTIAGWLHRYAERVRLVHCEATYAESLPALPSFAPRERTYA